LKANYYSNFTNVLIEDGTNSQPDRKRSISSLSAFGGSPSSKPEPKADLGASA